MKDEDVEQCLAIFAAYDMPEMKYGLATYRKMEPNGCYVLENEEDGAILSFCTCNMLDSRLAYIGLYGTKPGFQGKGLGIKVWNKVMDFIGNDRNAGLTSSPEQVSMYKNKAGFVLEGPDGMIPADSKGTNLTDITPLQEESAIVKILPLTDDLMEGIISYDKSIVEYERSKYLELCLHEPGTSCLVAVDPADTKKILGFGAMKPTNYDELPLLAPLYADSYMVAKILLYNLMKSNPISHQKGYRAFILDSNPEATPLAEKTGLKGDHTCPRLFTKEVVAANKTKVYAVISPAFGPY